MRAALRSEVRIAGLRFLSGIGSPWGSTYFSGFAAKADNWQRAPFPQQVHAMTFSDLAQVTVLGEVKIVGLLILSAIILPGESSQFTARMTVGCVLAMLGFCLYSNTKLMMARRAAARQAGQPQKQGSDMEEGRPLLQVMFCLSYRL